MVRVGARVRIRVMVKVIVGFMKRVMDKLWLEFRFGLGISPTKVGGNMSTRSTAVYQREYP